MAIRKRTLPKIELDRSKPLVFDYKNSAFLSKFLKENGAIEGRERTGLTAKEQRTMVREIKKARHLALLPFLTTI